MLRFETADSLDGADELQKQVKVGVNAQSARRLDALIPYRVPVPLHLIDPTLAVKASAHALHSPRPW